MWPTFGLPPAPIARPGVQLPERNGYMENQINILRTQYTPLLDETIKHREQINQLHSKMDATHLQLISAAEQSMKMMQTVDKLAAEMEEMTSMFRRNIKLVEADNKACISKISALANEWGDLSGRKDWLAKEVHHLKNKAEELKKESIERSKGNTWKWLLPSAGVVLVVAAVVYHAKA